VQRLPRSRSGPSRRRCSCGHGSPPPLAVAVVAAGGDRVGGDVAVVVAAGVVVALGGGSYGSGGIGGGTRGDGGRGQWGGRRRSVPAPGIASAATASRRRRAAMSTCTCPPRYACPNGDDVGVAFGRPGNTDDRVTGTSVADDDAGGGAPVVPTGIRLRRARGGGVRLPAPARRLGQVGAEGCPGVGVLISPGRAWRCPTRLHTCHPYVGIRAWWDWLLSDGRVAVRRCPHGDGATRGSWETRVSTDRRV